MAEARVMGFSASEEVRGTRVVKVREFHCRSLPSGTYFEFRRTPGQRCFTEPMFCAQQFADRIEGVLTHRNITDVDYFQDTTAAGRLEDWMRTFWLADEGELEGFVEQRLADFGPTNTTKAVNADIEAARRLVGGAAPAP